MFHKDGSGFESSTCYHVFSAEMVAWAVAFVEAIDPERWEAVRRATPKALPRQAARRAWHASRQTFLPSDPSERFTTNFHERVNRMVAFAEAMVRPNGQILQIGDNDSGRFIRFVPRWEQWSCSAARATWASLENYAPADGVHWEEDHLSYETSLGALAALAGGSWKKAEGSIEYATVRALIGNRWSHEGRFESPVRTVGSRGDANIWRSRVAAWSHEKRSTLAIPVQSDQPPSHEAYPEFGLYLMRTPIALVSIRCGPDALSTRVGHPHDDQLALTITTKETVLIDDPGTYVYTAFLERRNAYRSSAAHFGPVWPLHLHPAEDVQGSAFAEVAWDPARVLCFCDGLFVGELEREGTKVIRVIEWHMEGIKITDLADAKLEADALKQAYEAQQGFPRTEGYGKVLRKRIKPVVKKETGCQEPVIV